MTLQEIVAGLSGYTIPAAFVPTTDAAPVAPMDLFTKFGTIANNPDYYDIFNNRYDISTNTWDTEDTTIVPTTLRDDVAAWVVTLNTYASDLLEWQLEYDLQRDIQWREKMAEAILLL